MADHKRAAPQAADLYGDLEPAPHVMLRDYVPGLIVTALAALAAAYLSDHYGAPLTLMALLIGLALNFLSADERLAPGLAFASRTLLRFGIVLVGARITLGQVADLGPWALVAVLAIAALTLGAGVLAGRMLGFGAAFGTLAGGAVAICGASAALALATVLGEKRAGQAQLALVLVVISALSSLAMFLYPILAHHLGLSDTGAGFLIGASVHDVAQALGAGYAFSPAAGETAAIVKLTRVALLAPVLVLVAMAFPSAGAKRASFLRMPWFVVGFFALAALNSMVAIPPQIGHGAGQLTAGLLACAVAATGMRSPMSALLDSGLKPMLVILIPTLVALALAAAAAMIVMP